MFATGHALRCEFVREVLWVGSCLKVGTWMPTNGTLSCLSLCADYLNPVTATELEQELWSPQSTIV